MAELDKKVKDQLNLIETLKFEIEDLLKKKATIVVDINKPIYEAKAEAEKIVAEAEETDDDQ